MAVLLASVSAEVNTYCDFTEGLGDWTATILAEDDAGTIRTGDGDKTDISTLATCYTEGKAKASDATLDYCLNAIEDSDSTSEDNTVGFMSCTLYSIATGATDKRKTIAAAEIGPELDATATEAWAWVAGDALPDLVAAAEGADVDSSTMITAAIGTFASLVILAY